MKKNERRTRKKKNKGEGKVKVKDVDRFVQLCVVQSAVTPPLHIFEVAGLLVQENDSNPLKKVNLTRTRRAGSSGLDRNFRAKKM